MHSTTILHLEPHFCDHMPYVSSCTKPLQVYEAMLFLLARNKFQWQLQLHTTVFIRLQANIFYKMAAILFWPQYVESNENTNK